MRLTPYLYTCGTRSAFCDGLGSRRPFPTQHRCRRQLLSAFLWRTTRRRRKQSPTGLVCTWASSSPSYLVSDAPRKEDARGNMELRLRRHQTNDRLQRLGESLEPSWGWAPVKARAESLQHLKQAECGWGTISYPIRVTFLSEYVFQYSHQFKVFFTRILRFVFSAAFRTRIQQNTLYSQEYTQNTQRAKPPKSALRAMVGAVVVPMVVPMVVTVAAAI